MRLFAWINRAPARARANAQRLIPRARSQVGRPPSMARPSTTSPTLIVSSLSAYATAADSLPCTPRAPGARFHLLSLLGRTWYGHRLELERRRLRGARKSPAEVNTAVKAFADFYDWYPDEWDDSRAGCRAASGVDEPLVRTPRRGATVVRLSFISSYRGGTSAKSGRT